MNRKILVADDDPNVRESTSLLLEALGYEVASVAEAGSILDAVDQQKPDLVLQDLRMPGLNVAGLLASLRSNPATAEIPIVFVSANLDIAATAARYGAWAFIKKPFSVLELRMTVGRILGAPGDHLQGMPGPDLQRTARTAFHDYWNSLAALNNYATLLRSSADRPPSARSLDGLDELILTLEARTDRLRSFVDSLLSAIPERGRAQARAFPTSDDAPVGAHG